MVAQSAFLRDEGFTHSTLSLTHTLIPSLSLSLPKVQDKALGVGPRQLGYVILHIMSQTSNMSQTL